MEILGFHFSEKYKLQVKQSIDVISKQKKAMKLKQYKEDFLESDETIAFIAGYTTGGVPYGMKKATMGLKIVKRICLI